MWMSLDLGIGSKNDGRSGGSSGADDTSENTNTEEEEL